MVTFMVSSLNQGHFWVSKIVRHPYQKDLKKDPNLENCLAPASGWFLGREMGECVIWDERRGPRGAIIGIHSPIPY